MKQKRTKIIAIGLPLLIASGFGVWFLFFSSSETANNDGDIDYSPPTEQEQAAGDKQKEQLPSKNETASDNSTPAQPQQNEKKAVKPVITSWGQDGGVLQVSARVPGVFESGGTCTLELTKASKTVTGTSSGVENVSEVSCGFVNIARSKLSAGNWQATMSYNSPKATGVSETVTISVQ